MYLNYSFNFKDECNGPYKGFTEIKSIHAINPPIFRSYPVEVCCETEADPQKHKAQGRGQPGQGVSALMGHTHKHTLWVIQKDQVTHCGRNPAPTWEEPEISRFSIGSQAIT